MGQIINHKLAGVIHTNTQSVSSKDISEILSSNSWSGKRCIIIGGGPSLTNFDRSIISNELTIGINKEFMFSDPTINYSMDYTFFELLNNNQRMDTEEILMRRRWKEYQGIKVFLSQNRGKFSENIHTVNKIEKELISTNLRDGVYSGNNSGIGAIMLAIALGSKRIGLLGFDLKINGEKTHCHHGYKRGDGKPQHDTESMTRILNNFKIRFEIIAPLIKQSGIEVFNLNPDSALRCFEFEVTGEFLK